MTEETTEGQETQAVATDASVASETPSASESKWYESLPEGYKDHPSLVTVPDVETLAKNYVNAQKLIGRDKIPMPRTPDEYKEVYKRLGMPEDPSKYNVPMPEDLPEPLLPDEQVMEGFKKTAYEVGLSETQAAKLSEWYFQQQAGKFGEFQEMAQQKQQAAIGELRNEWGQAFEEKARVAQRAAHVLGGDEFKSYLEQSGLGNDPKLVKVFAKVGEMMVEDNKLEGVGTGNALTPAQLDAKISEVMAHPAYMDGKHPEHKVFVDKLQGLFAQKFPG